MQEAELRAKETAQPAVKLLLGRGSICILCNIQTLLQFGVGVDVFR